MRSEARSNMDWEKYFSHSLAWSWLFQIPVVGAEGLVASVEGTQTTYQRATGRGVSERSVASDGRCRDLRCYESCTRVDEPCAVRHVKVVVLPAENVRSAGSSVPSWVISQRIRSRTMRIATTQIWRREIHARLSGIDTCQLLCPFQAIKTSNLPLSRGPV